MSDIHSVIIVDDEPDRRAASAAAVFSYLGDIPVHQCENAAEAVQLGISDKVLLVVNIHALDDNILTQMPSDNVIVTTCRSAREVMDVYPQGAHKPEYAFCPKYRTNLPHHQKIRNGLMQLGVIKPNRE